VSYSLTNRGHQSDFHGVESFANQDSGLIREALDDLRVARRS
jgi:hypothetical protein